VPQPTSQTGAAGEFHVAAQLSQRGWEASILLGNAPRDDILARHVGSGTTISVQCKAANNGGKFQAGRKSEQPSPPEAREWFVFVGLDRAEKRPTFFVVPRNVIAAYTWCSHRAWLQETGPSGKPHQDGTMRDIVQAHLAEYRERWDDLLLPPDEVPYLLPDKFWDWLDAVGLPDGHPGAPRPSVG
jgi:hypothetical protein